MRSQLLVATAFLLGGTALQAQYSSRTGRMSAALGVTMSGAHMPEAFSGSVSARLRRESRATLVPQVDVTAISNPGTIGNVAATVDLLYRRPVAGLATYALAGAGMVASYSRSILTGGVGVEFAHQSRDLFAEFRVYGPTLHDMSGLRMGIRF